MIVFPNCKINLGLRVLNKREDGYHNIETVLYPVRWCDVVEAIPSSQFSFTVEGDQLAGDPNGNLCVRAFRLLEEKFKIPPVKLCLLKNIPVGAGLGGGSADAANTLKLLDELFQLELSAEQLKAFASDLGSDCAFFIENRASVATGRGELLEPAAVDLSSYYLMIVYPGIHIETATAYSALDKQRPPKKNEEPLAVTITRPVKSWQDDLINDFEESVFNEYPEIASVKKQFYDMGADYAAMSGSGSAVFGIFHTEPERLIIPTHYKVFRAKL